MKALIVSLFLFAAQHVVLALGLDTRTSIAMARVSRSGALRVLVGHGCNAPIDFSGSLLREVNSAAQLRDQSYSSVINTPVQ